MSDNATDPRTFQGRIEANRSAPAKPPAAAAQPPASQPAVYEVINAKIAAVKAGGQGLTPAAASELARQAKARVEGGA